jgi:E3 ubiquitin-protein ligase DMA1/2
LVPHLELRHALQFKLIYHSLKEGNAALCIGQFTDHSGMGSAATNMLSSKKLVFKSKVVSRAHEKVWVDAGRKFSSRIPSHHLGHS